MPYDPTTYQGAAAYYACGRAPYSRALVRTLAAEVGLNGSGRLFDVGCGPGTLTIELATQFEAAIGLDPDSDMLAEAASSASQSGSQDGRPQPLGPRYPPSLTTDPCC